MTNLITQRKYFVKKGVKIKEIRVSKDDSNALLYHVYN